MKKIIFSIVTLVCMQSWLVSCSLDEKYYSQLDQNTVYGSEEGFQGLVNACYENLYYIYGKIDGIGIMEAGSDLWMIGSLTGHYAGFANYYSGDLNSVNGQNQVIWNALYATIGYCNSAIYYGKKNFDTEELRAKTAEAHFIRGFAYFHIVEQWGDVVLDTASIAEAGAGREIAVRSSEEAFYERLTADLEYAAKYLPATQTENGRATSVAAKAMLAKAWLQRTRLYSGGKDRLGQPYPNDPAKRKECGEKAFAYAQQVYNETELYPSDATSSGSTKCWDGINNKTNKEWLFREAIDADNFKNPEGSNRGRTAQYYAMSASGTGADLFGVSGTGLRYRRQNVGTYRPTLYLLTKCFEPAEDTPDTRFSDSFYYKYYIASPSFSVLKSTCEKYGKDASTWTKKDPKTKKEVFNCAITGNVATVGDLRTKYQGTSYFADNNSAWTFGEGGGQYCELEGNDAAMGAFTPNWPLDETWCSKQKFLCANLTSQIFNPNGTFVSGSNFRSLTPSLRKFSSYYWCYTNQEWLGDFPIIRATDIYLIGAEAAIVAGNHMSEGLEMLNTVRKHAALSTNADKMVVGLESMTIDFILKERARELCGEQWRWYDLKRTGNITNEYLDNTISGEPRNPWISNLQPHHIVRPIPQQFLDQIANPAEFGTNGY